MSEKQPLEVDDAIVLLMGTPAKAPSLRDRVEGITRLEKLIFLLERETQMSELLTEDPGFEAHKFGPFSSKVYESVEMLAAAELIEDSARISASTEDSWESDALVGAAQSDPYATRDFSLTPKGRRYYEVLVSELPEAARDELVAFKARFASQPLRRLIRYVYQKYPKFAQNSVIRDQLLG